MRFKECAHPVSDESAMEAWATRFDATDAVLQLPQHMRPGLARWVLWAIPPGAFLRAVICGDLYEAVKRADGINLSRLHIWGMAMLNLVPAASIAQSGSAIDTVSFWSARGGILGRCKTCAVPLDVPGDQMTVNACDGLCVACATRAAGDKHEAQMMDLEAGDETDN